jgi:hypothetical protein
MGYLRLFETLESCNRILCLHLISALNTKGTLYILVCTDRFSKHVTYIPFQKTLNSETIITELKERIFSGFAYSKVIITSRGPQFKGKKWKKEMAQWGIATCASTTANPLSDG